MTDGLLTIGAFSRASLVSVKQLRAYHELGILVPVDIDPQTGYRRYSIDQLTDAAIIRRLRALDLPLADVRAVIEARDPARTEEILAAHRHTMEARLREVTDIVAALQREPAALVNTPVHLRSEKATRVLQLAGDVAEPDFPVWLENAYRTLGDTVGHTGALPTGPAGACYPPAIDDDGPQAITAYVPIADEVPLPDPARLAGVELGALAAVDCAVLVHVGSYDTIGDTYRALGAWVARHAAPHPTEPVREQYLISPPDTDDPTAYRTEICWPVQPGPDREEP